MKGLPMWMTLLALGVGLSSAQAAAPRPVFLKLNDYYVLHVFPVAPFVDDGDHVMVPLEQTTKLMGLNVTVSGSVAAVWNDQSMLVIAVGGVALAPNNAMLRSVGGTEPPKILPMPVPARLIKPFDEIVVPIQALIDAFNIPTTWDPQHRILAMSGAGMMKTDAIPLFEENLARTVTHDADALLPAGFSLGKSEHEGLNQYQIVVTLKNSMSVAVPDGDQALYTLVAYRGGETAMTGRDLVVTGGSTGRMKDPCVKSGEGFQCVQFFPLMSEYKNPISYIAVRVRLR